MILVLGLINNNYLNAVMLNSLSLPLGKLSLPRDPLVIVFSPFVIDQSSVLGFGLAQCCALQL